MGSFTDGLNKKHIIMDVSTFGKSRRFMQFNNHTHNLIRVLNDLETLRKLTKYIDFGCAFVDGMCKGARAKLTNNKRKIDLPMRMCCCGGCAYTKGYLRGFVLESNLETYNKLYKDKIGFWRPRGGCSLPRELRSSTCLYFNCSNQDISNMRRVLDELECEALELNAKILKEREIKNE